ncbi:5-hydroxytryptamine receptor 1-like [Ostrea edulis]|uniref:5-hydroxytryptamine receptor 1-like n=1 Tax=Ostrea edulis TaxID=37623 RepID=UPI0024AFA173|nr:5-hydroxytryptamine receptor 1-like [Ostrea edulis]XP_048745617.2 5-hydroxytryptamine receptor 1-like [Ostrea edulis]XP_048745619.2 5-hydroxytryptamine receptor 1-like [Ostrea edulis]XP_048745621.2 5-hydroxytryptamine receptor 1-like [Ostrea edulis]XP_048745622.2 5-hydroxytryptamine receptor 1-like [Ostrea edulis]XP_048745623.2 5-hydroxytryptamine receptor 1-like [Ostrea edulis]XP_048745625.2 5-hydroxytryptamine receptor 1-like [Ostrea edulis]XP_048745627.2 5-hydroxytryptamine receptor 1-
MEENTFPSIDTNTSIVYSVSNLSVANFSTTEFPPPQETTAGRPESPYTPWEQAIMLFFLILMMIGTIIGNSLVCMAVALVKRLQTPSNLLILSLAVSDLLVAVLVMPFAATGEAAGHWPLGDIVCDIFTSLDVILCTASILNLCMISVDRYLVITRPFKYAMKRTPRRMAVMIASVWILSVVISIPPLLGWKSERPPYACLISQEIGYQIYATLLSFYIPLMAMIFVYFRIWRVSSRLAKKEIKSQPGSIDRGAEILYLPSYRTPRHSKESDYGTHPNGILKNGGCGDNSSKKSSKEEEESMLDMIANHRNNNRRRFTVKSLLSRSSKHSSHKERRAIKTLGVIMGGFTACWLPFFILAVIRPVCGIHEENCSIPGSLMSIFNWLGYFNSFLNPLIYARFNREFRTPFIEILCCRCRKINIRIRSESYAEQYGEPTTLRDTTFRDSLKPVTDTVVRYDSQGVTNVYIGNGSADNCDKDRESVV